jgi:hypothetical protein
MLRRNCLPGIWIHGADPQILGNMTKTKASEFGSISRYQFNITVWMAVSVNLNRLILVPWGNARVPFDFLSQFLIEFAVNKITDHSWWLCSRQWISYRPSESSLLRLVNDRCPLVSGSIAPNWFMTACVGIVDHCTLTTGFSLDHSV